MEEAEEDRAAKADGPGGPGGPGGGPGGPRRGGKRQYFRKKKVCRFCVEHVDFIDYKKVEMLQPFVQERGKILPRRMTGTCSRHQRWLGEAIKRARNIALLAVRDGTVRGKVSTQRHGENERTPSRRIRIAIFSLSLRSLC